MVDVGHVEIVSVGDGFGGFTSVLDERVHLADADSPAADMGARS